jgi:hypothetical protein
MIVLGGHCDAYVTRREGCRLHNASRTEQTFQQRHTEDVLARQPKSLCQLQCIRASTGLAGPSIASPLAAVHYPWVRPRSNSLDGNFFLGGHLRAANLVSTRNDPQGTIVVDCSPNEAVKYVKSLEEVHNVHARIRVTHMTRQSPSPALHLPLVSWPFPDDPPLRLFEHSEQLPGVDRRHTHEVHGLLCCLGIWITNPLIAGCISRLSLFMVPW